MSEKGHISIHTENILPIIKKWLYAEKEIFIRELVSNASDAILKLQKLSLIEEIPAERIPEPRIVVTVDKENKQIKIQDTGLGMSSEEVKKYINQVAFSGVQDFVKKFEGKDDQQQIIGHFGLGFYSAFMVANKVEIHTQSYRNNEKSCHWVCDGSTEFTIEECELDKVGTSITLHIAEDSLELLETSKIKSLLEHYCGFLPHPIYIDNIQVNETTALWTKAPSSLSDSDYTDFYKKYFFGLEDPLFWIHLNVDYPFKLRGILFFPKIKHELEASQGQVKLYCNQVFVADNSKELIPEFLTLLKGMIDCPDLPLNVSRSYLQNDQTVRLISQHITKKVADKLTGMFKTERPLYEKYWDDINPFVKFGMMRDEKFAERMQTFVLFKLSDNSYKTPEEYVESFKDKCKDKIFYTSNPTMQSSYVELLKQEGIPCIIADTMIDQHFIPFLEMTNSRKFQFMRCDADILSNIKTSNPSNIVDPNDQKSGAEKLSEIFKKHLSSDDLEIKVESLNSNKIPAFLMVDENQRRLEEFSKMSAFGKMNFNNKNSRTLVINENNSAVRKLLDLNASFNKEEESKMLVQQIYDLAQLQHAPLSPDGMLNFIERSSKLLGRLPV